MSAVLRAREPSARYLAALRPPLVEHFDLVASAPGGVARLRELILSLAVQGKLVPQRANDEPAQALLIRIRYRASRQGAQVAEKLATPKVPYDLPSSWCWAQLDDLVENMGSGWSPACDEGERTDPTRWAVLRTTAVQAMQFVPREHKAIPLKLSPRPDIEVKQGDILITRAGPMNRVGISCWVDETPSRLLLSDKIVRFHSAGDEMLPAFVVLALNAGWTRHQLEAAKTGMAASQVNVSQADLKRLWLPVCSRAEQSRIVARVEELMRLCDTLEESGRIEAAQHAQLLNTLLDTLADSASADELATNWQRVAAHFDLLLDRPEAVDALEHTILQLAVSGLLGPQSTSDESAATLLSRIQRSQQSIRKRIEPDRDAIASSGHTLPPSWAWASVDQLAADSETAITDGPFGANLKTEHYVDSRGFRVVRLQNIGTGTFRSEHHAYIDRERFDKLQKHRIFGGDIVVAGLVDESIRCCIVPPDVGPAIVKADCYRFSVNEAVSPEFVCFYLSSKVAHEFASVHHHGLTLTRIGLGNFRSLPVPLPPFEEQRRIVDRVNQLRRLCSELREKLASGQATQARLTDALIESSLSAG